MSVNHEKLNCFLRLPEVLRRVGISRSAIYARVTQGEFPAPISLGGRAVAWLESDVDTWMADRISASQTARELASAMHRDVNLPKAERPSARLEDHRPAGIAP